MKYFLVFLLICLAVIGIYFFVQYDSEPLSFTPHKAVPTEAASRHIVNGPSERLLFVPYWGLRSRMLPTNYDQLIYFGVTPDLSGINTSEVGYKDIPLFIKLSPENSTKLLTVRMVDTSINAKVLKDKALQEKIISDSLRIAQAYNFSGIVLDFEYSALAFDSVVQSITGFSQAFASEIHRKHLAFYQTVYGDTFYRLRPYDVSALAKNADKIIIMAYDFHKANGDAGPNFPLSGKEIQGYDFKSMVDDFVQKMPSTKMIVVFGVFGYDWQLDDKGHSESIATPLSLVQIQQDFLTTCAYAACKISRDALSSEMKITYTSGREKHEVWFEDTNSIAQKSAYLHSQGINATALWAYSYF